MRSCVFCDQRATSAEHLLPEWILNLLGSSFSADVWFGDGTEPKSWQGRGRSAQLKVKYLCRGCNNGWMSDLETKVRYLIGPLMHDLSVPLDDVSRQTLAVWSAKTAMVLESVGDEEGWFYSTAERWQLRETRAMPAGLSMWLGRCSRSDLSYCEGRALSGSASPGAPSAGFAVTLAMGRLVVQVLTVRPPIYQARNAYNGLLQAWPLGSRTTWPPSRSIAEEELEAVGRRFSRG